LYAAARAAELLRARIAIHVRTAATACGGARQPAAAAALIHTLGWRRAPSF